MSCRTYFAIKLLAIESAASCARLVEINATLAPAGKTRRVWSPHVVSVGPPPQHVCHSLLEGCLTIAIVAGGGGKLPCLSEVLGSTGGAAGGGGTLDELEEASASV